MKVEIHIDEILKYFPELKTRREWLVVNGEKKDDTRTSQQNKSIHLYCSQLAEAMDELGLDMKLIVKPTFRIKPTMQNVKDIIWKNIQYALFKTNSTTKLKNNGQIDLIHDHIVRHLGENEYTQEVPYIPFPSLDRQIEELSTSQNTTNNI